MTKLEDTVLDMLASHLQRRQHPLREVIGLSRRQVSRTHGRCLESLQMLAFIIDVLVVTIDTY
jgi:hypothetical protein